MRRPPPIPFDLTLDEDPCTPMFRVMLWILGAAAVITIVFAPWGF